MESQDSSDLRGRPVNLVVLACKSNALRCRLLGSAREVTLRTAVRDEIPGSIITVTPKKHWTHARHPYLSGAVSAVRIDAEADELLHKVLALDLRNLDAHALLGERNLSSWTPLALRHFELGLAIGSLSVGEDFDGVLPWGFVENRPFLRCLHGVSRALLRCDRRQAAAAALRRLLRLDPADPLASGASLAAIEAGTS